LHKQDGLSATFAPVLLTAEAAQLRGFHPVQNPWQSSLVSKAVVARSSLGILLETYPCGAPLSPQANHRQDFGAA
jgi:hypothetical protein